MIDIGEFRDLTLDEILSLRDKIKNVDDFILSIHEVFLYRHRVVRVTLDRHVLLSVLKVEYPTVFKYQNNVTAFWYDLIVNKLNLAAKRLDIKATFAVYKPKSYQSTVRMKYQPTPFIKRGEFALAEVLDI